MSTAIKPAPLLGMLNRLRAVSFAGLRQRKSDGADLATLPAGEPSADAKLTLVWVGRGESHVMVRDQWMRTPSQDYEFSVVQRRFDDHWESVKTQCRRHPGYDGSAGPRDQVHHFRVALDAATQEGEVRFTLRSTYGDGEGATDVAFRRGLMEFEARGVSRFAPFNRYRIRQHYLYESGELRETVELFRRSGNGDVPFAKFDEVAQMMASTRFDAPPTLR